MTSMLTVACLLTPKDRCAAAFYPPLSDPACGDLFSSCCFTPTPQSVPAGASGAQPGVSHLGSCGHTLLPGGYELRFTRSPSSNEDQTGSWVLLLLHSPLHCLHVRLRGLNVMESDFWTVRRLLSFVHPEWDWKLGKRRGVQMSVAGLDTMRGHNGSNICFSGSVNIITGHKG